MQAPATSLSALARASKDAARALRGSTGASRVAGLLALARRLDGEAREGSEVLLANTDDVRAAQAVGLDAAMIERLTLTPARVAAMAQAVREIAAQDDPVGEITSMRPRPNGLSVGQVRVPLGVIAMIYEARPNVTIEAAALALKSANAVLLRGGKEAARSNAALGRLASAALADAGLPAAAIAILPAGDRDQIRELVALTGLVDLVIPRGGEGLIRFVTEHARVPVIQHYQGVCHMFVDEGADLDMAERLIEDSKLSRVSVCNALECLLVHQAEAARLLPRLSRLVDAGLELRGDATTVAWVRATPATDADWGREYLAKVLAVRVVSGLDEALDHIARFGSNHTEVIVTRDHQRAQRFLREVDASCVGVNASTRFNDGGQLGLGAEMGISTSKLHAYGPMGATHLTTLKWIVLGDGQVRG